MTYLRMRHHRKPPASAQSVPPVDEPSERPDAPPIEQPIEIWPVESPVAPAPVIVTKVKRLRVDAAIGQDRAPAGTFRSGTLHKPVHAS